MEDQVVPWGRGRHRTQPVPPETAGAIGKVGAPVRQTGCPHRTAPAERRAVRPGGGTSPPQRRHSPSTLERARYRLSRGVTTGRSSRPSVFKKWLWGGPEYFESGAPGSRRKTWGTPLNEEDTDLTVRSAHTWGRGGVSPPLWRAPDRPSGGARSGPLVRLTGVCSVRRRGQTAPGGRGAGTSGGPHDQEDQSWAHRPFRPRSMGGRRKAQSRGSCHTPDAQDVLLSGALNVQTQQIRPRASMALRHARRRRRVCDLPSRVLPASAVEPTLLAGPIRSALDGPLSRSMRPAPSTRPHRLTSPLFSSPDRRCTAVGRRTIRSSPPARTRWLPHRGARSLRPPAHSPLPHPAAR